MDRFDWQSRIAENVYTGFPQAKDRPVIGITGNYGEGLCKLTDRYYKSVIKAGGVPVIIPPSADTDVIVNTLDGIDGLLLSGGGDYNPLYCGEEPSPRLGDINSERDLPELLITRMAYNRQIPMLGICRGIQTLAMALGGKVAQDIGATSVKHSQSADRSEPTHTVAITGGSLLYNLYSGSPQVQSPQVQSSEFRVKRYDYSQDSVQGEAAKGNHTSSLCTLNSALEDSELCTLHSELDIAVNSFHHQAVSDPGEHFRVTAVAPDGVIEAVESSGFKPVMGVQWHPECLDEGLPLFRWLVGEAALFRAAKRLHGRVLTFDSHCDTPMFFSRGVRFDNRDPQLLVDLHKMTEGRQDATVMVAYLPQPGEGETFREKVDFDVDGPMEYADLIFDKIEDIVRNNNDYLAIARTPADLRANKHAGRKSIMLGIENGLALAGNAANVAHFARRGVVYITLCHNGDNDICDSARGRNTHGGVSRLGERVIGEMNRLGIMVDLSHASEKSFYDALDISSVPIVCSHSSARALCDHPRNLTDDQMRALARSGGVAQMTLYHGFLRTEGEATVMDFIAHLEHAIRVMGIDHVGIGTDFDGDGGVRGLACSSELIGFTRMMLARRYSESDLEKIWGGNFLRLMDVVQGKRV